MKLTKKLYEYKLNMPSEMLKQIGVSKHDEVDLFVQGNGIIVTKKDVKYDSNTKLLEELKHSKNEIKQDVKSNYNEIIKEINKPYTLKVGKCNTIYLPKSEFDHYNLSGKKYSVLYSYNLGTVNASLILSDKGNFKYRKDNALGLTQLFSNFKIEYGMEIQCTVNSLGNISLIFKSEKKIKDPVPTSLTIHHLVPKKEIDKLEQKDTFNAIIRKRYVITIPSEIFNKYELCRAKFNIDHTFKASKHILNIVFDKKGHFSFQKTNILPIKTLFSSTTLDEGKEVFCTINKRGLTIEYNDINSSKEEKDEAKDSDDVLEQIYLNKIEEFKKRNVTFKFIEDKGLLKETICSRCGIKLTKKDNSMMSGHRICNRCKSKKLNEYFNPIRELAKIRQKRGK